MPSELAFETMIFFFTDRICKFYPRIGGGYTIYMSIWQT